MNRPESRIDTQGYPVSLHKTAIRDSELQSD